LNLEDCRLLYDYNSWANHRSLDACAALSGEQFSRDLKSSFSSVQDTLVHIFSAEWIWLERWHGRAPTVFPNAADFPNLDSVRNFWAKIDRDLLDYVSSLTPDDLQRAISYKRMSGEAHAQPLWQLLQHVANHSTYHRGQIAGMVRQLGAKPISTDLILFFRDRPAASSA
jgi:uncharacterized damage-inducible protein DinB